MPGGRCARDEGQQKDQHLAHAVKVGAHPPVACEPSFSCQAPSGLSGLWAPRLLIRYFWRIRIQMTSARVTTCKTNWDCEMAGGTASMFVGGVIHQIYRTCLKQPP